MVACPKTPRLVDPAYRKSAKNRHCMVRHPETGDFCNGEGVVLAHIRLPGNAGTSLKPPDDESLFLCGRHHDEFDKRRKSDGEMGPFYISSAIWLVRNVFIPDRKAAYRKWKSEVGR